MLWPVLPGWACVSHCRGLLTLVGPGGGRLAEPMVLPIVILLLHTELLDEEADMLAQILPSIQLISASHRISSRCCKLYTASSQYAFTQTEFSE